MEVLQLGPKAELYRSETPEAERFLEFKLNREHVIQLQR